MAKNYIYRNIRKSMWSVMRKGIVVDSFSCLFANDVEFRVRPAGNAKAKKTGVKNVHAFAVPEHCLSGELLKDDRFVQVRYDPFLFDSFVVKDTGDPVYSARLVGFYSNGEMWADCINYRVGDS
jgi:hypothetical protein